MKDEINQGIQETHRFDAFLSYSHAVDGRLAPALRNGLHRFANHLGGIVEVLDVPSNPSLFPHKH